jgi:hypothetical protein
MAVELVLRNWCDVCLEAGTNTPGETVSVNVTGTPPFDVETCPEHGAALSAAVAALAALGRAPGKTAQPGKVRASKAAPSVSRGMSGPGACPECARPYKTAGSMRQHLRDVHDKSLADVGLAPARFTCETCGGKFDTPQGFAMHNRSHTRAARSQESA